METQGPTQQREWGFDYRTEESEMANQSRPIFIKMMEATVDKENKPAVWAAMNVIANLIVDVSPTSEDATAGVTYVRSEIQELVENRWFRALQEGRRQPDKVFR